MRFNLFSRKSLNILEKIFKKVWYNRKMSWQQKFSFLALALLALGTLFTFDYINTETSREFLTVAFLDVGQGDAIFIEAPDGTQVLIDSGPTSAVVRELSNIMPFYDRSLDLLIATHNDADHTAFFPEIFKRYKISKYGASADMDNDALYREIEDLIVIEKAEKLILSAGSRITLDTEKDIYMEVLWPPKETAIKDNNELSVVTRLVYGQTAFMLTGDLGKEGEEKITTAVESSDTLSMSSQILKAGHHGSRTSSSEIFVDAVSPEYAVVSAGVDNRFGHPHEEVVGTFSSRGVDILSTQTSGTIMFKSDGERVWLEK
jgi:competence protein ComEC